MRFIPPVLLLVIFIILLIGWTYVRANVDPSVYFGLGGEGSRNALFLTIGLLFDIIIIGVVLNAANQFYEQRKWAQLADELDTNLSIEGLELILAAADYTRQNAAHLSFYNQQAADFTDHEAYFYAAKMMGLEVMKGQRLGHTARAIHSAIGIFPIELSPRREQYLRIGLKASQYDHDLQSTRSEQIIEMQLADVVDGEHNDIKLWFEDALDKLEGIVIGYRDDTIKLLKAMDRAELLTVPSSKKRNEENEDHFLLEEELSEENQSVLVSSLLYLAAVSIDEDRKFFLSILAKNMDAGHITDKVVRQVHRDEWSEETFDIHLKSYKMRLMPV